jgi:molybdenum cofactor cytidylyltransferase
LQILPVILAAGQSSRLGRPKQLVQWKGKTLIQRTVSIVLGSTAKAPLIISGAFHNEILDYIPDSLSVMHNTNWQAGMGSSIQLAAKAAISGNYDALLLLPCDLPHLSVSDLQRLIQEAQRSRASIICSSFKDTLGIPVIFKSGIFEELSQIDPAAGAKLVISANMDQVKTVSIPNAAFDIDTEEDVAGLPAD